MVISCFSGTILTVARLANRKLLHEIYFNMFISKSDKSYKSYINKHSRAEHLRRPLTVSGERVFSTSVEDVSGSLYYTDLYDRTTILVLYI